MTRRISYGKAIGAGAIGSLIWGLLIHLMAICGFPVFDFLRALGSFVLPQGPEWAWFLIGMLLHMGVGSIWAIFYAFFFWSDFPWPPIAQGVIFAMLPALIAGVIMVPQLDAMNPVLQHEHLHYLGRNVGIFARHLGLWGPGGLLLGHVVYGLILGALYTHPVGYPVRRRRSVAHG
jgi:hypothetical protein